MAKRKSKRSSKYIPKYGRKQPRLPTVFDCPFCNHREVCEVRMDRLRCVGFIQCRVCKEDFQARIHALSEPIDVYASWIDACEEANQ